MVQFAGLGAVVALTAGMLSACSSESSTPELVRPGADSPYAAVVEQMTAEIPEIMAEAGTVGLMITLVDGDTPVWAQGFGYSDLAAKKPVTANTNFHIGSVSKTLSAIAVMQLAEQGKVNLDAPLVQYVPEFQLRDAAATQAITVRSVLDHHSGIPGDVFNGMFTVDGPNPDFRPWLLGTLATLPPERAVDEVWAYNNSGYVLLANLVENVSGQTFDEYTRTQMFEQMGMPTTSFDDALVPNDQLTGNFSVDVDDEGNLTEPVAEPREYINGWAAGSVTSSANEMANYLRMLVADGQGTKGQVLPAGALEKMWTPQVNSPLDTMPVKMGLGFLLGNSGLNWAGEVVWHNGATTWNFSNMQVLPESDLAVFVSGNTLTPMDPSEAIALKTIGLAYTAKTGVEKPADVTLPTSETVPLDPRILANYGGLYAASDSVESITAGATPDSLTYTRGIGTPEQKVLTLRPMSNGWFAVDGVPASQLRFDTVMGKALILARAPAGPSIVDVTQGERIPTQPLSAVWQSRAGTYVPTDEFPRNAQPFNNPTMKLQVVDGVLMLDAPSGVGSGVLVPRSETEAFTYGLGRSLGRNKGDLLAFAPDGSSFTFLGVTYVPQT